MSATPTTTIDIEFRNFLAPTIEAFKRSRITRFAKSNGVSSEDVHVHNQVPIWFLLKRFKTQNNIKSRLFKSLTDENKQAWLTFYNENKQLVLMTNENHKQFHDSNLFDVKSGTWKSLNPQVPPTSTAEEEKRVRNLRLTPRTTELVKKPLPSPPTHEKNGAEVAPSQPRQPQPQVNIGVRRRNSPRSSPPDVSSPSSSPQAVNQLTAQAHKRARKVIAEDDVKPGLQDTTAMKADEVVNKPKRGRKVAESSENEETSSPQPPQPPQTRKRVRKVATTNEDESNSSLSPPPSPPSHQPQPRAHKVRVKKNTN